MAPTTPAGRRWAEALASWAIPEAILAAAPESPWFHDPAAFAADETLDREVLSAVRAREGLPAAGGTVLDVGCGGGRSSLVLVPPAAHVTGVDQSAAMLASFAAAAARTAAQHREVEGQWPAVADQVGVHDVVVCHHVLYNVADIEPFVVALVERARRRVVIEITTTHPQSMFNEAWLRFHGLTRPSAPTATDAVAVLDELGYEAAVEVTPRPPMAARQNDPSVAVASLRRRLCLSPDRDQEIEAWLQSRPIDTAREAAVITVSV